MQGFQYIMVEFRVKRQPDTNQNRAPIYSLFCHSSLAFKATTLYSAVVWNKLTLFRSETPFSFAGDVICHRTGLAHKIHEEFWYIKSVRINSILYLLFLTLKESASCLLLSSPQGIHFREVKAPEKKLPISLLPPKCCMM